MYYHQCIIPAFPLLESSIYIDFKTQEIIIDYEDKTINESQDA